MCPKVSVVLLSPAISMRTVSIRKARLMLEIEGLEGRDVLESRVRPLETHLNLQVVDSE